MTATDNQMIPTAGGSSWLVRRRGPIVAVAAVAALSALALGQHWVAIADLAPLLYVLPCAAMMFVCMRHGQQSDNHPPK